MPVLGQAACVQYLSEISSTDSHIAQVTWIVYIKLFHLVIHNENKYNISQLMKTERESTGRCGARLNTVRLTYKIKAIQSS